MRGGTNMSRGPAVSARRKNEGASWGGRDTVRKRDLSFFKKKNEFQTTFECALQESKIVKMGCLPSADCDYTSLCLVWGDAEIAFFLTSSGRTGS